MSTSPLHMPQITREEPPTVLVIDDDRACLDLARLMLNDDNYECLCFEGAEEGWEALQKNAVSVVVSDLRLGAFELMERMRAHPHFATIPVIIATGDTRDDTVRAVMAAGAASFLPKPYSEDELLPLVRQCLTGKQA